MVFGSMCLACPHVYSWSAQQAYAEEDEEESEEDEEELDEAVPAQIEHVRSADYRCDAKEGEYPVSHDGMGLWLTRGVSSQARWRCSNHLSPEASGCLREDSFNGYVFIVESGNEAMSFKQAILVRHDLGLPKGKLAAQAAHAAVEAALRAPKGDMDSWRREGMAKIVLKVADEKELYKYIQQAKDDGLATAIISDAGHTVVEPGTVTCGAIGPAHEDAVDAIISALKLL